MMSEPMSEERLAELRANVERAEENTKWYGPLGYAGEMERDCLNEIDRLRAENERHRSALHVLSNYPHCNDGCNIMPPSSGVEHSDACARRIAWVALNPEPTA